ncbi:MAG: PfkB family carbohydrate kinase, partial [Propionicimonas sp.]|nr:PfkB family carbohydrate kinase [Propionicimonas sp.]
MELRKDAAWSLVAPTSMGVRLTPDDRQPVHVSDRFTLQATSAESNVVSVSSHLGLPVKVLTNFVEGSPVSAFIKANLRSRGISYEGPDKPQGGAWGYRHQFNIADAGFGGRAPRVWNDRAGEVGRDLDVSDFDTDRLFGAEGVRLLHLSGLIGALSPGSSRFCLDLARAAREHGTLVSFDLNYRASFWKGREQELAGVFAELAAASDILIGNEEDFQLALGIPGPQAGGRDLVGQLSGFEEMIDRVRARFGQARLFATTLREVVDANTHQWGALVVDEDGSHVAEPRPIAVLDRIGGGDGFVGGLLYGLLREWPTQRALHFGWACGAYAAGSLTDYASPADEDAVW